MIINLNIEQKRQLAGWLTREKDFLLSIEAMAEKIQIPAVSGSLELISNDLDSVEKMRFALRPDGRLDFLDDDLQIVLEVAEKNKFADKRDFWNDIRALLTPLLK